MDYFEFYLPTRIKCGPGVLQQVGDEVKSLGMDKVLVITDQGLVKVGLVDRLTSALRSGGITDIAIFDEIQPNPRDTGVQKAYELAVEKGSEVIVTIGGGSSIDTAKGVALLMTHGGGRINDYEDPERIVRPSAPIIAIPTTVGTGSEVTFWAVITDTARHFKMGIGSPLIAPRVALVDPELVATLPPAIVASTGVDALTHAIEGYTCKIAEPITDALGLYAIELIGKNIRKATFTDDAEAKANMLVASLIAGICFGQTDVAAVHCVAEALGAVYDIPHGMANACMLPYVMEFNFVSDLDKFARIATALGEDTVGLAPRDAAMLGIEAVRVLNEDLGIPKLGATGARLEDIELVAEKAAANVSGPDNPRPITKEDYVAMLRQAFEDE